MALSAVNDSLSLARYEGLRNLKALYDGSEIIVGESM